MLLIICKCRWSNLHVFLLYFNVIISYSFKVEFAIIKSKCSVVAAILEITQDALCIVAVQVQTLHFNVFFIKYTPILSCKNAEKPRYCFLTDQIINVILYWWNKHTAADLVERNIPKSHFKMPQEVVLTWVQNDLLWQ